MFLFQATCNALGAYLTEIDSPEEQQFIEDIKTKSKLKCHFSLINN